MGSGACIEAGRLQGKEGWGERGGWGGEGREADLVGMRGREKLRIKHGRLGAKEGGGQSAWVGCVGEKNRLFLLSQAGATQCQPRLLQQL